MLWKIKSDYLSLTDADKMQLIAQLQTARVSALKESIRKRKVKKSTKPKTKKLKFANSKISNLFDKLPPDLQKLI